MRLAARCSYFATPLFIIHVATFSIQANRNPTLANMPSDAIAIAVLALARNAVVAPVIGTLPSAGWARIAGYTWLIGDLLSELTQVGGASKSLYLTLRLVAPMLAALWISATSARMDGPVKSIGYVVAGLLLAYSLASTLTPAAFILAILGLMLLPLWFGLIHRRLDQLLTPAPTAANPS
ncbi:MAG TPA: hypothetical protein VF812_03235 [Ktedonobacterales bacterium]